MNQTFVAEKCQVFALPWHKFKVSDIIRTSVDNIVRCNLVWFSDPSCMGGAKREGKGLVNNSTPGGSITAFLPAVLMREKQMSRRCES